jgi:anthraniloyl-CoA monooxygenase
MACTRRIAVAGAGPAGLAFARELKRLQPRAAVTVHECRPEGRAGDDAGDDTGLVLPQTAIDNWRVRDPELLDRLTPYLHTWSTLAVRTPGDAVVRVAGHPYVSLSRAALLDVLAGAARDAGVVLAFGAPLDTLDGLAVDLVVGADGIHSRVRELGHGAFTVDCRTGRNRHVWLTTRHRFPTFTFLFAPSPYGIWCGHAYPAGRGSTVIVEAPEATVARAGLADAPPAAIATALGTLFATDLHGHALEPVTGGWQSLASLSCTPWSAGTSVLIGDAAHTAHFSIGSGTRLAIDDALALASAIAWHDRLDAALAAYEAARRPAVESLRRAADASAVWFEGAERYAALGPDRFTFSLLTRSLRMTHRQLAERDPAFVARVDRLTAEAARVPSVVPPMFTPVRLRDLVLPNRIAVSPMCQYMAADGAPTDWHVVHLGSRAVGGAGLVIAEMTDVTADGRITPGCTGLYRDVHVAAWRRIVDFVHAETPAKIGIQLGHAGRKASVVRPWEGEPDQPLAAGGWPVVAPSPLPYRADRSPAPHALTRPELQALLLDYVRAVERADAAGFDLIELHMAHGYLLASFISPLSNHRDDEYGGTLENRLRFPLEVLDACRRTWPGGKPLTVRISAVDWVDGGTTADDAVVIARALKQRGADAVDCSSGFTTPVLPPFSRQFQTPFADRIRHEADIATMAVGGISAWDDANTIVAAGRADLVLLGREHLFNPYWTRHAAAAQGYTLPWPKPYSSLEGYRSRSGLRFE